MHWCNILQTLKVFWEYASCRTESVPFMCIWQDGTYLVKNIMLVLYTNIVYEKLE